MQHEKQKEAGMDPLTRDGLKKQTPCWKKARNGLCPGKQRSTDFGELNNGKQYKMPWVQGRT